MWVRLCERCGRPDLTARVEAGDEDVTEHPSWSAPWACRHCGGTEFALMERDEPAPDDWLTGE